MTETASPVEPMVSGLLDELVDDLSAHGMLGDDWRRTFRAVPRHLFVPDVVWRRCEGGHELKLLRRTDQPATWLEASYRDEFLVTQINDGAESAQAEATAEVDYTSSISMPSVVAEMLAVLRVQPGMSMLEIGTGTGWNAALLAHRFGGENITTVEIDPDIAARSRAALSDAGYGAVTVITGDGTLGYPGRALYDRVLSTACVYRVPYPWIAQTRPGGLVVTPWATDYYNGHLLRLTVQDNGTAIGNIVGKVSFMAVRDQRVPRIRRISDIVTDDSERHAQRCHSQRHPRWYVSSYDAKTAIGIRVPRCKFRYTSSDCHDPDGILWFLDQWSGSWAAVHHQPGQPGPYRVRQFGPRQLFDEVSAAYQEWKAAGKPPASAWKITVTSDGQRAALTS